MASNKQQVQSTPAPQPLCAQVPGGDYIICKSLEEYNFAITRINDFNAKYDPELPDWQQIANMISLELTRNRIDATNEANTEQHRQKSTVIEQIRRIQVSLGITREQEMKRLDTKSGAQLLQEMIDLRNKYKEEHLEEYTAYCPVCEAVILLNRRNTSFHKSQLSDFEEGKKPIQKKLNVIPIEDLVVSDKDYEKQITQDAWDIVNDLGIE